MCRCACWRRSRRRDGPNQILRENAQRRIAVFGNGDGKRDMAAIIADIRRVVAETKLAAGLHHAARRHVPGAGGGRAADRRCCRCVSLALVFIVLYSRYQFDARWR